MDSPWVHTGLGESAQLECVVQGNPQPQVRKVLQMKCVILPLRILFSEYFSKLLHMYTVIFDQCFIQSSTDIKDCWQRKPSFVCIFGKFYCFRAKVSSFSLFEPTIHSFFTTPLLLYIVRLFLLLLLVDWGSEEEKKSVPFPSPLEWKREKRGGRRSLEQKRQRGLEKEEVEAFVCCRRRCWDGTKGRNDSSKELLLWLFLLHMAPRKGVVRFDGSIGLAAFRRGRGSLPRAPRINSAGNGIPKYGKK